MPIIRIEMAAGRTPAQKRELAQALTRETCRIAGTSPSSVMVIIEDVAKENWAVGGKLLSDA